MRTLRPVVAAISRLRSGTALVALLLAVMSPAHAWEDTPRLRIYYLAYPVDWNGKTIMIGTRLQLPFDTNGKIPAVVILHGTAGLSYSGPGRGGEGDAKERLLMQQSPAVPSALSTFQPVSPSNLGKCRVMLTKCREAASISRLNALRFQ
jgi:hypothetical protein